MAETPRRPKRKRKLSAQSKNAQPSDKVVSLSARRSRPKRKPRRPSPSTSRQLLPTTQASSPSQSTPSTGRRKRRRSSSSYPQQRNSSSTRRLRLKLPKPILYPIRFAIVGIGIAAFIGTLLAISNSKPYINATQDTAERSQSFTTDVQENPLPLTVPLVDMRGAAQEAIAANDDLNATLLFVDLDTGEYLDIGSAQIVSAASTIKVPVLVAFLEAVDQGKVQLKEQLTVTDSVRGGGSGNMQYRDNGTEFSALFVASEMSINSDNTATNMIIDQLGGFEGLNRKFQEWGMQQTQLKAPLPDLEGENQTTARDLALLMAKISRGDILSTRSRDRLMRIMGATTNNRLLPQSLGEGAAIAHKTGDIGVVIGDVGIVDMPNGKRYIASIFVTRPYDDPKGKNLLHEIGKMFYQHLDKNVSTPIPEQVPEAPNDADESLETATLTKPE